MSSAAGKRAPKKPSKPKQVAGITPIALGDQPPYHVQHQAYDHTEHLRLAHAAAWEVVDERLGATEAVDELNRRHASLALGLFGPPDMPLFRFLLNDGLLERIEVATANKGSELSEDELLQVALMDTDGAVEPDFSTDAINALVASYYASPVAFNKEAFLANMYTCNISLNYALGGLIADRCRPRDRLKIKELSSGVKTDHWLFMAEGMRHAGVKDMDITITDFVRPPLSNAYEDHPDIHVRTAAYNLFDDFPVLPQNERIDVIFASYAFDSVWQPEDIRLTRVGDNWYQSFYRLKVADWNPRKDELLTVLRERQPLPNAQPSDYMGVFIEEARQKVHLEDHPHGELIRKTELSAVNVPGGMVKRVAQAFDSQLSDDGIFIIGEAMMLGAIGLPKPFYTYICELTGVAARYKIEDYMVGRDILEQHYGLRVDLVTFDELAETYLPPGWQNQVPLIERQQLRGEHGNALIVVSKRKKP
ncbi:MAG TPA: hypothetical protein VLI54_01175 [Bacillota bacterium]|nr:hypothetical protein [Bacillota bacterium]